MSLFIIHIKNILHFILLNFIKSILKYLDFMILDQTIRHLIIHYKLNSKSILNLMRRIKNCSLNYFLNL